MNITVIGTGYVGLVTGVCLSDIGHKVICLDIDEKKVEQMRKGISPIYEPGLDELMLKNIKAGNLSFTASHKEAFEESAVIYVAVGTPQREDGSANLEYIEAVALNIAKFVQKDTIVVTKSTVPVGTNDYIKEIILKNIENNVKITVASNPEFLREGSAIYDTFYGDRIVIGTENEEAASILEDINKPFGIPVFKTNVRSAEMIKYAANAFLATKISFINEISNICEKVNADIEDVAYGMGLDKRIGSQFLKAGIGYGGSCFPKDTTALVQIAGNVQHDFELLKAVINVNNNQQQSLVKKMKQELGSLEGKKVALLGLAFKPNTDDMREAASIVISEQLIKEGASIFAYDPIATENAKKVLPSDLIYCNSVEESLKDADVALLVTEWEEFRNLDLGIFESSMKSPVVFDGRNCYDLNHVKKYNINYYSVGREPVVNAAEVSRV